jgi:hypothetical protein
MDEEAANVIRRIDNVLDDQTLDEETADELVELLTPGSSEPWPDLEAVLHLAEHPAVADGLKKHAIPDRLEQAIGEALEAVFPLLGIRPYGPTFKLVDIARRRLDSESHKYDLVSEKLQEVDDQQRVAILSRYLDTDPAPMFVNRFRRLYPEIVPKADEARESGEVARGRLDEIVDDVESRRQQGSSTLRAAYEATGGVDSPADEVAALGLASDDSDEQVIGAALMDRFDLDDLLAVAFRRVMEGADAAPLLAVITSKMRPERARNAYSTFIGEVSWQNPELPEAELTPDRARAILTARSVLPELGSPMERLSTEELEEHVEDPELLDVPETVAEAWETWDGVST